MGDLAFISPVLPFPAAPASQAAAPPSDAEARRRALDTESSCIVEAPAGSGKTGLLMQRLLKLLAHSGVNAPEEVLAITFTNKATAELRHRVFEQLQLAAHEPAPNLSPFDLETRSLARAVLARDRTLGWGLLDRQQRLNIRTIDSVAAEIARSLPLLSGSGGLGQPAEDPDPLYREAARRTLRQLGGPDAKLHAALHTVLLHRDGSLTDCERLLARMLKGREQWGELVPLGPGALDDETLDRTVRPRLERSLEDIVCAGLSRAMHAIPPGFLRELAALAARLADQPGYKDAVSPISICASRPDEPDAVAEHLEHWLALIHLLIKPSDGDWRAGFAPNHLGFSVPKFDQVWLKEKIAEIQSQELREALCEVRCLPPPRYPEEQWIVARALFHLLRHALAELKLVFAEHGRCDFAEFALSAREALRADPTASDFVSAIGCRLQHLLVDEMQDTSTGQYELIELLTRSWDGHSQTLFLVGDPKQSIYLFRQARVERFLRTMREERLGDLRLQSLRLSSNFRSQAVLVQDLNGVFGRLFPLPSTPSPTTAADLDVPFAPATPTRAPDPTAMVEWHLDIPQRESPDLPAPDLRVQHARDEGLHIRRVIEAWRMRPLPPGRTEPWRIAVLARIRNHLTHIVEEFKSAAHGGPIRFRAVDIDSLAERQEVLDTLALIRALLHPADRIAWLAVLHAPWCGLSKADLLRLTGEGPDAAPELTVTELLASRAHLLSVEGRRLLARCWPVLEAAVATLGRDPFSVHLERTWRSLGGDAPLTPEARANVLRVISVVRELEAEGRIDLSLLSARIGRLYAEPVAGEVDVELMTIHKAKGLEWDVVIVPGLERRERISSSELLNWLELDSSNPDEAHVLLAPIWGKGEASDQLNKWIRSHRGRRERAERKRLFYVACTRAREELHLFASASLSARGDIAAPNVTSLLSACWPVAQPLFERLTIAPRPVPVAEHSSTAWETEGLALAAAAEPGEARTLPFPGAAQPALLHRLPLHFDPVARFDMPPSQRLPYPPAADLSTSPVFDRPEGSFAVRAFGNVVHRYLQVLTSRRAHGASAGRLLAELPSWQARLATSLRSEGLPPSVATREAARALRLLANTLADPIGQWILSPSADSSSELEMTAATGQSLRADRIFTAGDAPGEPGATCVWIVDFKTSEQGGRSSEDFGRSELLKYQPQLQAYAEIYRSVTDDPRPVQLGLYYPGSQLFLPWKLN